jgi:hypothetical protein
VIATVYPTSVVINFNREVEFREVPDSPDRVRIWASHLTRNGLTFFDTGLGIIPHELQDSPRSTFDIDVPEWLYAAWMADEPLNVLFDWLLENRGDQYPWLERLLNGPEFRYVGDLPEA